MPVSSQSVAILDTQQSVLANIDLSKGRLKAVSVMALETLSSNAAAFCQITLHHELDRNSAAAASIASGYLGSMRNVGWTGDIPVEDNYRIQLLAWGWSAFPARLSVLTETE